MRSEIRVLGIDDSPFQKNSRDVLIVGTFFRGGNFMDGLLSTYIRKDGANSTKKISEMILNSKFYFQIRAILLDGIAVGGFNVIDINKLSKSTKVPVIVVMRKYPDKEEMFRALRKIRQEKKIKLIEKAGAIYTYKKLHFQIAGINEKDAKEILDIATTYADIPEPLRIAHLIASGIIKGESSGQA